MDANRLVMERSAPAMDAEEEVRNRRVVIFWSCCRRLPLNKERSDNNEEDDS